jgi:YihY family inner membrane protein
MSTARLVPETWELSGDDARETLRRTGRTKLVRDAFVRFRASDGFSHARSLAFVTSLLLVQGVILLVGLAAALGDTDVSGTIVRTITEAVPGPAGKALTDAVFHAYATGASGQRLVLVVIGVTTIVTGSTLMGQMERALNRQYGIEQDRPTLRKYGRALALALTAGVLSTAAFAMFALGHGIGQGLHDHTVTQIWNVVRWPLALVLMMAAIALLFRWSPNRHQPAWSWLAYGSTVSVLLWSVATLGLGLFFQSSTTFSTTYGPLAGMIALLLWSLFSSVAILFGAAIAVQLEAVRAGASAPRDERKVEAGSGQGSPALAGTA